MKKTGTTTISIVCSDGIVMAADKRMTAGNMIADRETNKVLPFVDDIAVTTAGTVSEIQRTLKIAKAELKLLEVRTNRKITVKDAANLLVGMAYVSVRQMGDWGVTAFLIAGKDINGFSLYDAGADGTLKKEEKFASDGSGSIFALPILESKYKKGMTVKEGVQLAIEALNRLGIKPIKSSIRGGTDGSRLSYMGLPTPNLFAGGHNFHAYTEYVAIQDMHEAVKMIVTLAQVWEEKS